MPKRSNDFQRLVRRIYSQTRPRGATVAESAMLCEPGGERPREVDVLLSLRVADADVTIAIECRDHSRPATVEWIASLIGKYDRLPVHRLIAVSRSGFTAEATRKADEHRIETRTLREALDADWPRDLLQPMLARVTVDVRIEAFFPESIPTWPVGELPKHVSVRGTDVDPETYMRELTEGVRREVGPYVASRSDEFQLASDFTRAFELIFKVNTHGTIFMSASGQTHAADTTYIRCLIQLGYLNLPVTRQLFGSIGVTTAIDVGADGTATTLTVAQEPGGILRPAIISRAGEPDDDPPCA